jgi:hypothetical protein
MAKRNKAQVGFEWDVQPYAFLNELRAAYTQTVMLATQKRAETISAQATQWMKQNAPWTDQTGSARKGLFAKIVGEEEQRELYDTGMKEAVERDKEILRERQEAARERRGPLLAQKTRARLGTKERTEDGRVILPYVPPDPVEFRRLKKKLTQRQYQKPTRVPKRRSAVAQFEREWRGAREPLVEVKFSHDRDLTYPIWLEIANQGRFAIIARAVQYWGKILMGEVKKISTLKQYRDKIIMSTPPTQQEMFAETARQETIRKNREYEPWSPERQARRAERRPESAKYKERAAETRASTREYQQRLAEQQNPLRKFEEKIPERMSIDLRRSR